MRAGALVVCVAAAVLAACTQVPDTDLQPGDTPDPDTTEAGLWMHMDRMEGELRSSRQVVDDQALNDYLEQITCRLAPLYCGGIRIYVVEMPYFNATMAPNGMMEVWTGLLLRVENEAQLAFVLAHELEHYIKRHSLKRWVDLQNKSNAASAFSILTSAAGVGYAGYMGELVAMASLLSYSRDQEREADAAGAARLAKAGYDPRESARLWQALLEEKAVSKKREAWVFFSTHPGAGERIENLEAISRDTATPPEVTAVGRARMLAVLTPNWDDWLGDELTRGAFGESEVLFRRLQKSGNRPGLVHFYLGELYRKRGEEGDLERAIQSYGDALQEPHAPARVHRSLGQSFRRSGRSAEARAAYEDYLQAAPDAPDRAIVRFQIERLR